jgi:hypothetical protein
VLTSTQLHGATSQKTLNSMQNKADWLVLVNRCHPSQNPRRKPSGVRSEDLRDQETGNSLAGHLPGKCVSGPESASRGVTEEEQNI